MSSGAPHQRTIQKATGHEGGDAMSILPLATMSTSTPHPSTRPDIAPGVTEEDIYPFIYDKKYPFVFCSLCRSSIIIPSARPYLLRQHQTRVSERQRNIAAYSLTLLPNMAQSERELDMYQAPIAVPKAIPYLDVQLALKCRVCHHACRNARNMQKHCRVEHGQHSERRVGALSKADGNRMFWVPWRDNVTCQQFFKRRKLSGWFEVLVDAPTVRVPGRPQARVAG